MTRVPGICLGSAILVHPIAPADAAPTLSETLLTTAQPIFRAAYIYGYPIVDGYNILYNYSLDPASAEYKGPMNAVHHSRNVATPADRAIIAPNVDTPYSHAWLDLRAEPVVLTIPPFTADRYVSLQLIDLYTYITGYVSPRTNGNRGGRFLVAGPGWRGSVPKGIDGVLRPTTDLALGLYRVQLMGPDDLANVHRIQDGFRVQPLSAFLGKAPPPPAPVLKPVPPVDLRKTPTSPEFFKVMNWMLAHMPVLPNEREQRLRFATIGVRADALPSPFNAGDAMVQAAMAEGLQAIAGRAARVKSSAELFGSQAFLGTDYLTRAAGAMLGIYGNAADEFLGVGYRADADGKSFDGKRRYRIRFAPDALPPVKAFWSITVYDQDRLLYANPANRHVINAPMVKDLVRDIDGGITIDVQHEAPAAAGQPNWLPVPAGPFGLTFRTYLLGDAIRQGQ